MHFVSIDFYNTDIVIFYVKIIHICSLKIQFLNWIFCARIVLILYCLSVFGSLIIENYLGHKIIMIIILEKKNLILFIKNTRTINLHNIYACL